MTRINIAHIGWLSRDEGPDCKTVAWCDINEEKMARRAESDPDIAMYTDYRRMLKRPGLDAVVIATPNYVHAEQAIAFLEAGKHVLLEKPMGINKAETDAILAAAERSGKHLVIDFEMRASPFAKRVRELIDGGEYGELRHIEFVHHRGGWLEEGNGIWRTRPEKSGGYYFMEPIHEVDIFRFFGGDIVAAQSTAAPNVLPHYRFEDNVCSHFFFESGALGTMLASHTTSAHAEEPADWEALGHDMTMVFTLTRGAIHVDFWKACITVNRFEEYPTGTGALRIVPDSREVLCDGNMDAFGHDITAMRKEFIRRLANNEPPIQTALDAWKTHQVCLAAEQSLCEDFRRVEVDYDR